MPNENLSVNGRLCCYLTVAEGGSLLTGV